MRERGSAVRWIELVLERRRERRERERRERRGRRGKLGLLELVLDLLDVLERERWGDVLELVLLLELVLERRGRRLRRGPGLRA